MELFPSQMFRNSSPMWRKAYLSDVPLLASTLSQTNEKTAINEMFETPCNGFLHKLRFWL